MTWCIEGIAYGPDGQSMEVTWGGYTERPPILRDQMQAVLEEQFPRIFGCDPTHVEAHIREETDADPGEAPTAV